MSDKGGLSPSEAKRRLAQHGPNLLRVAKQTSAWRILLDQLRSVVVLLLIVASMVAVLTSDLVEAVAIVAVLLVNTLLGFFTEIKARRAIEALLRMETPHATVLREGRIVEIEAAEVVPGDVIVIEAGQAIPADARLIHTAELRTNEAALTGESLPEGKRVEPVARDASLPDRTNMLYKGTTVADGSGRAVVVATGTATELGRIGHLVSAIREERTPLELRLDALGRRLVWFALLVGGLVVAIGSLQGMPIGQLVETGIALAIAAVPEGLPAVSTIALAAGVRRMARRNALVRRLPSVETLGSVTVICTDKTGTLTAGEQTVTTLWVGDRRIDVSGIGYAPEGTFTENGRAISVEDEPAIQAALKVAALANRADVNRDAHTWVVRGDPTEAALLVAARKAGLERAQLVAELPEAGELPFSSERRMMATFHRAPNGELWAYVKGGPLRILELSALNEQQQKTWRERNEELAARGLRVLALAFGKVAEPTEHALNGLTFVGLAGMIDPAAPGVKETIRVFRDAGIRTVMITGDQQLTAQTIARDLGMLAADEEVLAGKDLIDLSESELTDRVQRVGAFSRISPEDKLRIVSAYRSRGDIVAMLGDGVNDAAALKQADVGVAMGKRGTDVAKEAAAVVLQDDRFQTIGAAIEEGRVIFDNIRKFVFYLFSCNLAEVFVLVGASLVGAPMPLLPIQILWLNLVTDTFPALALALEPAEPEIMRRGPRDPHDAILSVRFLRTITFYALLITAATLGAFAWALSTDTSAPGRAVTITFMTLAFAQAFHLGNARSKGPVVPPYRGSINNHYAIGAVLLVVMLQLLTIYVAPLARVLETHALRWQDWLAVLGFAAIPAMVGQMVKVVIARRQHHEA